MAIDVVLRVSLSPTIGESSTWLAEEKPIFSDQREKSALYRLEPETASPNAWEMPSDIGAFVLTVGARGAARRAS
jgi:hypothetical protein